MNDLHLPRDLFDGSDVTSYAITVTKLRAGECDYARMGGCVDKNCWVSSPVCVGVQVCVYGCVCRCVSVSGCM